MENYIIPKFYNQLNGDFKVRKEKLSATEKEILRFWKGFAPYESCRVKKNIFKLDIKFPKENATEREVLKFYESITPKKITELIEVASRFTYPIIDIQDLKLQIEASKEFLIEGEIELVTNLRFTDFPLTTLRHVLDITVMRSISAGLGRCWNDYQECLERGGGSRNAECERTYNLCSAEYEAMFAIAVMATIEKFRPRVPSIKPSPQPFPF